MESSIKLQKEKSFAVHFNCFTVLQCAIYSYTYNLLFAKRQSNTYLVYTLGVSKILEVHIREIYVGPISRKLQAESKIFLKAKNNKINKNKSRKS